MLQKSIGFFIPEPQRGSASKDRGCDEGATPGFAQHPPQLQRSCAASPQLNRAQSAHKILTYSPGTAPRGHVPSSTQTMPSRKAPGVHRWAVDAKDPPDCTSQKTPP